MAAAVANYTPEHVAAQKIAHDDEALTVTLAPTPDILADVVAWRAPRRPLRAAAGRFCRRDRRTSSSARGPSACRKGIDVIVANDVSKQDVGFDVDANAVTIIGGDGDEHVPRASKSAIAAVLADRLEQWLARQSAEARA